MPADPLRIFLRKILTPLPKYLIIKSFADILKNFLALSFSSFN